MQGVAGGRGVHDNPGCIRFRKLPTTNPILSRPVNISTPMFNSSSNSTIVALYISARGHGHGGTSRNAQDWHGRHTSRHGSSRQLPPPVLSQELTCAGSGISPTTGFATYDTGYIWLVADITAGPPHHRNAGAGDVCRQPHTELPWGLGGVETRKEARSLRLFILWEIGNR